MAVSFIWFDLGYTLIHMQRESSYQQALRDLGFDVPLENIEREFHLTDKLFMREYPGFFLQPREVFMPTYLGLVNYHLGIRANVCKLNAHWEMIKAKIDDYWRPYKGITAVLDTLQQNSIGLGVISNWDCTARDILNAAGLIDYFDPIIISCEVGCSKPNPAIFKLALQTAAVDARNCIYIGDNYYDDAVGSRTVGMPAVIINRFGSLGTEEISDCPVISDISQIFDYLK